jgi:hypothetical protein
MYVLAYVVLFSIYINTLYKQYALGSFISI